MPEMKAPRRRRRLAERVVVVDPACIPVPPEAVEAGWLAMLDSFSIAELSAMIWASVRENAPGRPTQPAPSAGRTLRRVAPA